MAKWSAKVAEMSQKQLSFIEWEYSFLNSYFLGIWVDFQFSILPEELGIINYIL